MRMKLEFGCQRLLRVIHRGKAGKSIEYGNSLRVSENQLNSSFTTSISSLTPEVSSEFSPAPAKPLKPTLQQPCSGKYLGNLRKVIHIFVAREAVLKNVIFWDRLNIMMLYSEKSNSIQEVVSFLASWKKWIFNNGLNCIFDLLAILLKLLYSPFGNGVLVNALKIFSRLRR